MWMRTHDGGLVAFTYGPCEVTFRTADDVDIVVREETEYPFDRKITFTIDAAQPVAFPLLFRIPRWLGPPGFGFTCKTA